MLEEEVIQSSQNAKLKSIKALRSGKHREYTVLEGAHLLEEALANGAEIEWLLVSDQCDYNADEAPFVVQRCQHKLMAEVSRLDSAPDFMAWVKRPVADWREAVASLKAGQWCMVAAGVQDPGNLGALTRIAAGLGAAFILATKGAVSPWHPRAVRGAAGTNFRLPVFEGVVDDEFFELCATHKVSTWATCADGENLIAATSQLNSVAVALILGEEGRGLAPELVDKCSSKVGIPLTRDVESLNVATAAAIFAYQLSTHV
ncbi:MAG: TrmH family RNA methyltransferase [Myxococcota bacterium]|jgi:TrmH family RNA methyltransferase